MGAFTLIIGQRSPERAELEARQNAAMEAQGFAAPQRLETDGGILFVYPKQIAPTTDLRCFEDGDFVAVCGTFFYRANTGAQGLQQIYRDFVVPNSRAVVFDPLPCPIHGTYVCIVRKAGRLWIFIDRVGFYKVYCADERVLTSSFLTAVACVRSPRLNPQSVYEYVFQGATYGNETVIEDVRLLDAEYSLSFDAGRVSKLTRLRLAEPKIEMLPIEEHGERIGRALDEVFDECVDAFGGQIDAALSGGYDSRLILAHLLKRGVAPNVHVYGKETDADVRVAKAIAAGEGFMLTHIDKNRYRVGCDLDELAEIVEKNFYAFDGLPSDGILDSGADLATRKDRAQDGGIALNGGGGEIFRNFFYLPDRQLRVVDVFRSFYSQYDPAVFTGLYPEKEYRDRLTGKIGAAIGTPTEARLTRAQVERIYPVFRCRYWMGRNSAVNNRLGAMHTPLIEPTTVERAGNVPVAYKNQGRLAAALIRRAYPKLASYHSAYGHAFDTPTSNIDALRDWVSINRPTSLRRVTFPVKTTIRRKALSEEIGGIQDTYGDVIGNLSRIAMFLNLDKVIDPGQFRRLATLEHFLQKNDVCGNLR